MAKDKLIPTWLKVAAIAALFVPYSVKLDKDGDKKIKKVSARSVATRITYTPKQGDKESELDVSFFGAPNDGGKRVYVNKEAVREDLERFCGKATEKVKVCAKKAAESVKEICDKYISVEEDADTADIQRAEEVDAVIVEDVEEINVGI